jgi:RNA polymerase sigma-70 factor, ECF subfamily
MAFISGVILHDLTDLSTRSARGDTGAFRKFVECTTPLVYRLALRTLRSETDAQDAVQETYIRAWRSLSTLRDHKASLSWLCGVVRNVATDMIRQRGKNCSFSLEAHLSDGDFPLAERLASMRENPEEILVSAEARAFVRAVIDDLPTKHRVVLVLREIDGLGYEEIAAALGCPRGTVESRLHRARAGLAKRIRALAKRRG